ncbi:hypothetical protein A2767_00990 [Candidatus Roizmanbacteria bacterium RIFCSPHIGHO2_01_FULL_35_10]|uniref:DUF5671 domain-containing protein n=1 Tax=Candidatus Roizmanbacteria bacterium RIFCSPLOWO2_01_FULL_35_13 TaxID=1802055 RepID=A0A1F7I9G9_9BACT|nr:MAG: hypothetical protein A2767_00990 [Candidatus Roizmanbacteria bacterium RIFCSPHIGHO2_01_FULL_35_10]OGK40007.1 MAG: hypothetical protein A3A74_06840 [Candidatus Roizmanbacteria bacterium RIFCSPLOWO2_01_FULL_35_13]
MQTIELLNYIKQARLKGLSDQEINTSLINEGWSSIDIQKAMENKGELKVPKPNDELENPQQTSKAGTSLSMWDAFEHILLFISLYVLATSVALTLHYFVDKWFPGVIEDSYNYRYKDSWNLTLLRGYIASLIVSYPLFAFFFLKVAKRTEEYPDVRNLNARKSLTYFTLVVTFIIVLVNIISLIYGFLNGNATINFILHFLITVSVSGAVFAYYLNQVKEDKKING